MGISPLEPLVMRAYIVDLGASFIKLAQVLATRNDFLKHLIWKYSKPYMMIFQQCLIKYSNKFLIERFQ